MSEATSPLRVAVFVTNAAGVYGGGRLAAFLLAQCLARAGAEVSFVTNVKPVFYDELRYFGHPGQVALHLTKDFHLGLPGGAFDIVVLIPGQSQDRTFYMGARGFAHRRGARLVLFNFETPNWFNSLAPEARTEDLWLEWRRCLEDGLLVLSNSEQSMRFAKRYYASHPQTTHFDFWHQPINLKALARVQPQFREKRVVCFVRARDPHKGGQDLIDALSDDLRGWTLSLIVGSAKLDDDYREAIQAAARRHGIGVEVKPLLSDTEKFVELKRARMLLYPSLFEGYGIPPIEALASATPCVCYDLPVFREVCGDALLAAPLGSIEGLQENIRRVIQSSPDDWNHLPQAVASVSSILNCGNNALQALERYLAVAKEPLVPMTPLARERRPQPPLVHISSVRLDPGGYVEVRGWTPLRDRSELVVSVNGQVLERALRGQNRQDVLDKHGWLGRPDCGFVLLHPFTTEEEKLSVTVTALGADGTQFDSATREFETAASRKPAKKPDPKLYQRGGIRALREAASAVILGWAATAEPLVMLQAFAGPRPLWVQRGRARPDVMAKLADFPPQAPAFGLYLDNEDLAALEAAKEVTLVATTANDVFVERFKLKWEEAPVSQGELPAAMPAEAEPDALPVAAEVRKVTYDEYGVIEFEGWVLNAPRIDLMRFWFGDTLLGEGVPDRLYLNIFEKRRVYGDALCGFHFAGRAAELDPATTPFRVDFCLGDEVVHSVEGKATQTRRAAAALGADAVLAPPGFLDDPGRPPAFALVVDDETVLDLTRGAVLRATLSHLREGGHEVLLVLHGNPHRFVDDLPRWQRLSDAVVLVNPVHPVHGAAPGPDWSASSPAVESVLAALVGAMPRLVGLMVQHPRLAPALPAAKGPALLVLEDSTAAGLDWAAHCPPGTRLVGRSEEADLPVGFDISGLAAQVPRIADPSLAGVPLLLLNGVGLAPEPLGRAIEAAAPAAAEAGLRLGVVVDAPPLMPPAALRASLGLPEDVLPVWLPALCAAPAGAVRMVVDLGQTLPGPVEAVALAGGHALGLWREMAPAGLQRIWPSLGLAELVKPVRSAAICPGKPYAALEAILGERRVLPEPALATE
ncbi:glycosyltransferase [Roseomonas sp. KE2513]|uniref:glycosyltransferase n=1 Tax=Roseomonas sp. KE2513 TaxID=2479202 RepID=UPI0018DFD88A|nr:glycosyltransferase [Roseomonas sp. KE2513]MBI0534680.1 glycosyltransferase [Roseomonas sp. KE2513]